MTQRVHSPLSTLEDRIVRITSVASEAFHLTKWSVLRTPSGGWINLSRGLKLSMIFASLFWFNLHVLKCKSVFFALKNFCMSCRVVHMPCMRVLSNPHSAVPSLMCRLSVWFEFGFDVTSDWTWAYLPVVCEEGVNELKKHAAVHTRRCSVASNYQSYIYKNN